jgi:putative toxin-antitoxin system antitoxin component (TIGR02293 family)
MKSGKVKSASKLAIGGRRAIATSRAPNVKTASAGPFKLGRHIRALTAGYDFTERDLAHILDVNKRTITRWKAKDESLSQQQMDRIRVLESILDLGKRVLGSENEVKLWLHSPVFSLEGQKPMELIKTESGRRRVENVLLQIEGGVY